MSGEYIVFSDSHGRLFREALNETQTHVFPACSAKGLGNKNSKLGVNKKILELINKKYNINPLIYMFGKVDLDFVSNYKYNINKSFDRDEFIKKSVDSYISFLQTTSKERDIYVCEPYLCHLNDTELLEVLQGEGHFMNIQRNENLQKVTRSNVIPYVERIEMYSSYNNYLKDQSTQSGFTFLEINEQFKCADGSFKIPERFLPEKRVDHHLSPSSGLARIYLKGTDFYK